MNCKTQVLEGVRRSGNCSILCLAVVCGLLLLNTPAAMAQVIQDQCFGALPLTNPVSGHSVTGCGALITVNSVDGSGVANGFTVTLPGNNNPYDGLEDTLVGVQNNSGNTLNSLPLSSISSPIFGFDSDGPCNQDPSSTGCPFPGTTGYEGPGVTFTNISDDKHHGTVNFSCIGDCEGGLPAGDSAWFALEATPDSLTLTQQAVLTFTPTNPSAVATFNCSTNTVPCTDPGAHSMKFTVGNVTSKFDITLQATEVDGDGICQSGTDGDPTDPIDCRFTRFFGETGTLSAIKVPRCYPYSSITQTGTKHCVFYSVQGAPPRPGQTGSPYSGGVNEFIAWNTAQPAPTGWIDSPRMYDDPSDDHDPCCYPVIPGFPYRLDQADDNQFVFDITTSFVPTAPVGTDPGTGGKTNTFNDFVIAWPFTLAKVQQPINSDGSSIFNAKKGVIPVKFNLTLDGAATCNLPPALITLSRLSGASNLPPVDENLYSMAADNGSNFRVSSCQYIYNLQSNALGAGQYKAGIIINGEVVGIAYFGLK